MILEYMMHNTIFRGLYRFWYSGDTWSHDPVPEMSGLIDGALSLNDLMTYGTDVNFVSKVLNYRNEDGDSYLHMAARKNHFIAVDTLLFFGFNPNVRNNAGQTPLHVTRRPKIARCLLDEGGDVNLKAFWANVGLGEPITLATPLRLAIEFHYLCDDFEGLLAVLFKNGADPSLRDGDGKVPADCLEALSDDHKACFHRLVEKHHNTKPQGLMGNLSSLFSARVKQQADDQSSGFSHGHR